MLWYIGTSGPVLAKEPGGQWQAHLQAWQGHWRRLPAWDTQLTQSLTESQSALWLVAATACQPATVGVCNNEQDCAHVMHTAHSGGCGATGWQVLASRLDQPRNTYHHHTRLTEIQCCHSVSGSVCVEG